MPKRPPTACRDPHCPHPAQIDGWCPQHWRAPFAGHTRMPRGWQAARAAALRRDHHRCVDCGAPATQVDHIRPRAWGGAPLDLSNLASVCKHCHDQRTARTLAQTRRT